MALQEKQLAQARELGTTAVSVYSPSSGTGVPLTIVVSNTTNEDATPASASFTLYQDNDGTTYNKDTQLFTDVLIPGQSVQYEGKYPMDSTGNLAYKTSVGGAITITVWGFEVT